MYLQYCIVHANHLLAAYVGKDHPALLPVVEKTVKVTVEESVRYSLTDPEAEEEWVWSGTLGDNAIRLGEGQQAFVVAMHHELHCLRQIRRSLARREWSRFTPAERGHMQHCFNYLREWMLCSADVTLEPGDFTERNFTSQRTGATHKCKDWEPVYNRINTAWSTWEAYRNAHGMSEQSV